LLGTILENGGYDIINWVIYQWWNCEANLKKIHECLHGGSFIWSNFVRPDNKNLPKYKLILHKPSTQAGNNSFICCTFFDQLSSLQRSLCHVYSIHIYSVGSVHFSRTITVICGHRQKSSFIIKYVSNVAWSIKAHILLWIV